MSHQHQDSSFSFDSLYCDEDPFEEETNNVLKPVVSVEQHLFFEDEQLSTLFSKEKLCFKNMNSIDLDLADSRNEAVEWILNVVQHYSFSALTALLAINYLDRFLFSLNFQKEKPWMTQLAAVTCLSLAAKVEETNVPLLLDLQVEETEYLFEAKTIQRMEILVLSNLGWKMNPVTPLSFVDYTVRKLGLINHHSCFEFLNRCEHLLISVSADCRSMCYLPSVIATVTMLYVINGRNPCIGLGYHSQILAILGMDKEKIEECCKFVEELTSRGFGRYHLKKRKFGSLPRSPNRVMDLYLCSESSNDSYSVTSSVSSSPEPLFKKVRAANADQT